MHGKGEYILPPEMTILTDLITLLFFQSVAWRKATT
jgi:hypothetical protein